jgi:ABC-type uncharacterized transport system permease subunit
MSNGLVIGSIATAILAAAPVLIAASGELLAERVGVYNIGIEGSMLLGAFAAVVGADATGSLVAGLVTGIAAGTASSFVLAVLSVVFRAELVLAGLAVYFVALGITGGLGSSYTRTSIPASIPRWSVPGLSDIPYLGPALFRQLSLTYVAFLLPVAIWFLLYRTRHGLNMRAIGESPATADIAGIRVTYWRVFYTSAGGAFAGLGGAFLTLGPIGTWVPDVTAGQGWIALAIVIFSSWEPFRLIAGALTFGGLEVLGDVAQAEGWNVPSEVFSALPYIGTIGLVIILAWHRSRTVGWLPWPAALGQPFFRGAE